MRQAPDINGCISFALKWIQNSKDEAQAIKNAKASGLITNDLSSSWSADTKIAEKLLQNAIIRLPSSPDNDFLAQLFVGLGEISARSHADLKTPIKPIFSKTPYKNLLPEIINRAIDTYTSSGKPYSHEEINSSRVISEAPFSWNTLLITQSICSHLDHRHASSRYGIYYAVRLFLEVDTEGFSKWFQGNKSGITDSVTSIISEELVFKKDKNLISSLLSSDSNFLALLSASSLMTSLGDNKQPDYKEISNILMKSRISSGDTVWITSLLLKEAIHSRYRLKDNLKNNKAHLTYLKSSTNEKNDQNINHEKGFLKTNIEKSISSLAKTEDYVEKILIDMNEVWPTDGMTPFQLEQLNNSFINTREIKYKLAIKLKNNSDKEKLLRNNIDDFKKYVGIDSNTGTTKDYLSYHDHDSELLLWASYSFVELYKNDKKKLSRRIGHLVKDYTDVLNKFIDQPYILQRQYEKWVSATSRLAILHYFVLTIYSVTPGQRKKEVEGILPFAIDHILFLFRKTKGRWTDLINNLPDMLIKETANLIISIPSINNHQSLIIHDKTLPEYLRVLIIWGNPSLTQSNIELAKSLSLSISECPHLKSIQNMHFNQILNVLDIAVANSTESKQQGLIISLWEEIYNNWKEILINTKWKNTAKWLISTIEGDDSGCKQLLESDIWKNSFCSLKVNAKNSKSKPESQTACKNIRS